MQGNANTRGVAPSGLSRPESQQVSPDGGHAKDCDSVPSWSEVASLVTHGWLSAPRRERFEARAADETLAPSQRRYADVRARALAAGYWSRVETCQTTGAMVACGCGKRKRWNTCRKHLLCWTCQRARAKKSRARIRAGLEAAGARHKIERKGYRTRYRAKPVFVTATLGHSGDVGRDWDNLADAWTRFRKALGKRIGWFEFVCVNEVTPGRDGLGHVHMHFVCFWPWFDWDVAHELWKQSVASVEGMVSRGLSLELARSVRGSAVYLGKYISKGVQAFGFSPDLRARVLAGTYGKRWVSTSVGFWAEFKPECPCCGQSVRHVIVHLSGTANHRWESAQEHSPRGRFLDEHELPGYQCTIE